MPSIRRRTPSAPTTKSTVPRPATTLGIQRMKLARTALVAALTLAIAPAFAQTYSQTVFFGDSLTDSGFYRPFLVQQNPQANVACQWRHQLTVTETGVVSPGARSRRRISFGGLRAGPWRLTAISSWPPV